jgi:predicted membrane protein
MKMENFKLIIKYFAIIIVVIGFIGFLGNYQTDIQKKDNLTDKSNPKNYVEISSFLGGNQRKIETQDFKGGEIDTFMGGTEIDLKQASINGQANINLSIMMGGLELKIPKDWLVEKNTLTIMGGVDDNINKFPEAQQDSNKKLILTGDVFMGGIEIKRY